MKFVMSSIIASLLVLWLAAGVLFLLHGCSGAGGGGGEPDLTDPDIVLLSDDMPDATKKDGEDQMCWAMAACNVLVYAGYSEDENHCVSWFSMHRGNTPYNALLAIRLYLTEYLGMSQAEYLEIRDHTIGLGVDATVWFMAGSIAINHPIALHLYNSTTDTGHSVSVFGYKREENQFTFYVTDGDDNVHTRELIVNYLNDDFDWQITWGYTEYKIGYAMTIEPIE